MAGITPVVAATVDGMTGGPDITVRKAVGYVVASDELLMDCGVIPDTRPPPPPVPWRRRMRWKLSDARDKLAGWAYRTIAGHEIYHGDDW